MHHPLAPLVLLLAVLWGPAPAAPAPRSPGKVFLTVEEALALAFPDCEVERGKRFLTKAQKKRAQELAGVDVERGIVYPYTATREGELVGTAYFDTRKVRTLKQSILVVVAPDETIARIEIVAFGEPEEYIPRESWYAQFLGGELGEELRLKRGIDPVVGATLTARATVDAARSVLALHRVLRGERPDPGATPLGPGPGPGAEGPSELPGAVR